MCAPMRATASPRRGLVPCGEIAPAAAIPDRPSPPGGRLRGRRCSAPNAASRRRSAAPRTRAADSSPPIAAPACRPSSRPTTANSDVDAEMVEQHRLRAHHVANGDDRKVEAPRHAGVGIGRRRPGGAHAAAEDIGADDEIALGVDRPAGADHGLPPAGLAGQRMGVGDVLIAGERMADQHGVAALGIERAVGLIGDLERARSMPASSRNGSCGAKRTSSECGWSASRLRSARSSVALASAMVAFPERLPSVPGRNERRRRDVAAFAAVKWF